MEGDGGVTALTLRFHALESLFNLAQGLVGTDTLPPRLWDVGAAQGRAGALELGAAVNHHDGVVARARG